MYFAYLNNVFKMLKSCTYLAYYIINYSRENKLIYRLIKNTELKKITRSQIENMKRKQLLPIKLKATK